MEFIAVIIVWGIIQYQGSGKAVQRDGWFYDFGAFVRGFGFSAKWTIFFILLFPSLLILLLHPILSPMLFGLPLLALNVLVLLYCIGRGDFNQQFEHYLDAWRRGDLQASYEAAKNWKGHGSELALSSNAGELNVSVRRVHLYHGFQRWFAVVFWFICLGPVGALFYRLSYLYGNDENAGDEHQETARGFLLLLEWLPVRLLGFTFALLGNYGRTFSTWVEALFNTEPSGKHLEEYAAAALDYSTESPEAESTDGFIVAANQDLLAQKGLMSRSMVFWIVAIAIVQMI